MCAIVHCCVYRGDFNYKISRNVKQSVYVHAHKQRYKLNLLSDMLCVLRGSYMVKANRVLVVLEHFLNDIYISNSYIDHSVKV